MTQRSIRLPMTMELEGSMSQASQNDLSATGTMQSADKDFVGGSWSTGDLSIDVDELSAQEVVQRLEELQAGQRSLQQPSQDLDRLLAMVLAGRPELRPRLAVMCKSALLRKKILTVIPSGGRSVGSGVLGATHPWRKEKLSSSFTDHNWPKVSTSNSGLPILRGGDSTHHALLRAPADKLRQNPVLEASGCFSVPKARRFPSAKEQNERQFEIRARQPPGPGHYSRSVPRGTAFTNDGGETIILGANHACPWKGCLGRQINPVEVDATTGIHAPCFSFPKTRRAVSDPSTGQSMNAVKSDSFNLSPGPVYELFSSVGPSPRRSLALKRSRSTPSMSRVKPVRVVPTRPQAKIAPMN